MRKSEPTLKVSVAKVLKIDPQYPEIHFLEEAAEIIKRGGVIAHPTETVYGLGADAFQQSAVERVYRIKGRAPAKPMSVIIPHTDFLKNLVETIPEIGLELIHRFWPGPLTIVLNASPRLRTVALGSGNTLGIRIPASKLCLELLNLCQVPMISSSANRSGQGNPFTAQEVLENIGAEIDLIIDGGKAPSDLPSTVIDLSGQIPLIRRQGTISVEEIEMVVGKVKIGEE